MARNYNIHVHTLAQVASLLRVDGSWPGPLTISGGWFRARARPWNESITDPMLRVDRGGADFLTDVSGYLHDLGVEAIYSPALYGGSTRMWRRAGFGDYASLDVMERGLNESAPVDESAGVRLETRPDWDEILAIDRVAFEGFWGMSRAGLNEALDSNRSAALFVSRDNPDLTGYAIVGSQWGTVYLHRIAVRPESSGHGIGKALLAATINWGRGTGGRSMALNVRPENEDAKRLYRRLGFIDTATELRVLRHCPV